MERWQGKVAFVTGASAGIGAAIVEKLVEHGLKVVGVARRVERIEELSKKLSKKPGKLYSYKVDMTKDEDIIKAIQWTIKTVGPIHILINNAGTIVKKNLLDGKTEDWRLLFETNVLGLCTATREAVNNMLENKIDGHIIHINSVAGHKIIPMPGVNVYGASKYAVRNLAETLKHELVAAKSKTKITNLSPGYVVTEIQSKSEFPPEVFAQMPSLSASDIADAVVYVLGTPQHVQISELTIQPVGEQF